MSGFFEEVFGASVPLIFVVERDLLSARDPALGEEADPEFAVDGPLLRLGHGVAAVVDEAGDVAAVGRVDEVLGLELIESSLSALVELT